MTSATLFAAANPLLVLLVLGVTLVFYLVQAVFKSTMEPKKLQPPARPARPPGLPTPQPAPNQAINSLEEYLKEARRRRAMEAGAIPPMPEQPRPIPPPPARPTKTEASKPVLVPVLVPEQRASKPPQPTIPVAARPAKKAKPQKQVTAETATQAPALTTGPSGRPTTPAFQIPATPSGPSGAGFKTSPLAQLITGSLRDPKSIAGALVLREILGPPVSARNSRVKSAFPLPEKRQMGDSQT